MPDLVTVINQIIQQNREESKPTDLAIGTVETASPLSVRVSTDMAPLPEQVLLLCDSVKTRSEDVTASTAFAAALTAAGISISEGDVIGSVDVQSALSVGDKVIMLRCLKGQEYIILSKV
jgi:hypothetical protein